jgi:hypothetical protein
VLSGRLEVRDLFEVLEQLDAAEWPGTAAILRQVAQSYESDSRPNEDEAECRRQGHD